MIAVESLGKRFKLYRTPTDRLKEIVLKRSFHESKLALDDISFTVESGRTLGIIGQNGAGKSTLLKILNGVLLPDAGTVTVKGRVVGLLELGTGFNPELTGLSNTYMNGMLLGMSRPEIDAKLDSIQGFAELASVATHPLKTYSSGMVMRLAFSIAIHSEPVCFLIDEALSVGDAHFQQKCFRKIREHKANGGSIVFVSHDMNAVKILCDEVILLDGGKAVKRGDPEQTVNHYNYLIATLNPAGERIVLDEDERRSFGSYVARINRVEIVGRNSKTNVLASGESTEIRVSMETSEAIADLNVGILIRNNFGQDVYGTTSWKLKKHVDVGADESWLFSFILDMNLGVGKYTLSVALSCGETHLEGCLEWKDHAIVFDVLSDNDCAFEGICRLEPEINVQRVGCQ